MHRRRLVSTSFRASLTLRSALVPTLLASALSLSVLTVAHRSGADGAGDNQPDNVRRIPPPGVEVPAADRDELQKGADRLGAEIEGLQKSLSPQQRDLLPDVQIYHNALRYALTYNEFFSPREIQTAKTLLQQGLDRAAQLKAGKPEWTTATGLIVRGYVSQIDGSVQPYGLVVPEGYDFKGADKRRLDVWYHGRGETLSELNFINDRQRNKGEFTPTGAFVLHPYGRYCNANRFAGEMDTWEALDAVGKHYRIDASRLVDRGFSMGGAAAWLFATHYPGAWAAANPGAGFSETAEFLKVFQNEPIKPTWYQQKLWHWYDSTDYAANLFDCPVIAYSGEVDGQRQAATAMVTAASAEGLSFKHVIGPGAAHFYEANAKKEVAGLVDELAARGNDFNPPRIQFVTWMLRYNRCKWVQIDGMAKHWEQARIDAERQATDKYQVKTRNITAFSLILPTTTQELASRRAIHVAIDGAETPLTVEFTPNTTATAHFTQDAKSGKWVLGEMKGKGLHKLHNLQGPIDDAFMDSFVMVTPSGTPRSAKVGEWVKREEAHAIEHWRRQFRGEARVKADTAISNQDIANNNLILWGDPGSNKILARIASKLPIKWDAQYVKAGTSAFASDHHAPILIYLNPLNPKKYIVLNSGFTYREYDYLNNARQTAKLPDYAVVDVDIPASSRAPGGIVKAGFFDEKWELQANDGQ